jgi:hypothetical protein
MVRTPLTVPAAAAHPSGPAGAAAHAAVVEEHSQTQQQITWIKRLQPPAQIVICARLWFRLSTAKGE